MLERVRTAEFEALVTEIGTLGVAPTSREMLAGSASRAQSEGIIGTISAASRATRRVVATCTSCRHTCKGTIVFGRTTRG